MICYLILIQIIWFIPSLHVFMRMWSDFIWKYAHCWTDTHCGTTAGQPHTATRTAGHAAHCMNLNAGQLHTAHYILHTAHSHTAQ
jgi:hypothetical protein